MPPEYLSLSHDRIAYQRLDGDPSLPGVIFLGGFASDMTGTKASYLAQKCQENNYSFVRFDYRGNGQSSGIFTDCTLTDWLQDTVSVFDRLTKGPQIVIGSSMGGWLGLMLTLKRQNRVCTFIGIAAAPDFTEKLVMEQLNEEQRAQLDRDGQIPMGHAPLTKKLILDAKQYVMLDKPIPITCPVRLLQGRHDEDVPWDYAERIARALEGKNVQITLIDDGDHRLNRTQDLERLWTTTQEFL